MKKEKLPIIILHGWGTTVSGKSYSQIQSILEKDGYRVYAPDLPGFGNQKLLKPTMDLDDYVEFVETFMDNHKIDTAIFIAHSFGGRIIIKLAYKSPKRVEKIVLSGSPLIKRRLPAKKRLARVVAHSGKTLLSKLPSPLFAFSRKLLYYSIGEWDYYKAGDLRETFKKIISEDLTHILPRITAPVLIIWGQDDTFVPLKDGQDIAHIMPHAHLVVIPEATHRLPYQKPQEFSKALEEFIHD